MWFVIVITHLGSALPSCFTTLFPFWKNSSIFCSSNDVAGKPNCHLCCVKEQHHRMLNALAWFGQGHEHRCCQWKKSVSATVFGHHCDQWHMTYIVIIPYCLFLYVIPWYYSIGCITSALPWTPFRVDSIALMLQHCPKAGLSFFGRFGLVQEKRTPDLIAAAGGLSGLRC